MPKTVVSMSVLENPLQNFLKNHKANETFTHTSIGNPKGSYYISNSNTDEFINLYTKVVFEDKIPTHLTEGIRDCEYTPIKIDIDFRYYRAEAERIYVIDDIIRICQLYMENIEEYLESPDNEEREFFILEKPGPTVDKDKNGVEKTQNGLKRIKDGVHIMAPRLITNTNLQLKLRESVFKKVGAILDKYNFDNPYADIFDRAVIDRNNWQMYGSSKPGQPPYAVTHIVRVWKDKYELVENNYNNLELVSLLSVRNKMEYSLIKPEKENEVFNEVNNKLNIKNARTISVRKKRNNIKSISDRDMKLVMEYIDCLDAKRASNYKEWIELGWCLHNIQNCDDILLNKWIEFSQRDPSYAATADDECRNKWDDMCDEGLGIGSLKLWAKKDNPERYAKIVQNDISDYIFKACKHKRGTSVDVARVIHAMYKDYFVCVSIKDGTWFYYSEEDNKWVRDDKGITLRRKISTEVYQEFNSFYLYKQGQSLESDDSYAQESQKIYDVMIRLKDTSFKNNIMIECSEIFYDKDRKFLEKLDSYNHLMGFKNGVLDLKNETFRIGRPEDYVSMSTSINYIEYDPNDPDVKDIQNMYKSIIPIRKVRDYVFRRTASFLSGSTRDETFDIYSGGGGNGKSKHMELVEACLGDYACKLPVTLLTMKRGASNAATPELARTKGKRLATLQEPDSKTRINVGLMKEITGGDKIQARALYGEPFEFKPKFKLVLCCNDKPELPPNDDGTWRRVRNTEFISKFVHEPQPEKILHFKINQELSDKFENWAEPFMSILVHYHKLYRRDGLNIPDEILEYTNEYRATNNHFRDFINDRVEDDPSSNKYIALDTLYRVYVAWYKEEHNDNRSKQRKELKAYLDERYGSYWPSGSRSKDKGYKGIKIKYSNNYQGEEIGDIVEDEQVNNDELD